MPECPGHLVSVSLKIAVSSGIGAYDLGKFFSHAGLFGNTNFHFVSSGLREAGSGFALKLDIGY